ncbi:MAG: hypothetical protein EPN93_03835 [Spirochaetes bacterium]|nr:MAG: hypothetical protein EPN93_03835 [Spirochaetota bacterium]
MKRARMIFYAGIACFLLHPLTLHALQTNFQFSPPPIPWYEFNEGDKDARLGGTAIYLKGDLKNPDEPEMNGSVDVYGGGGSWFGRYAFRKHFAIDIGASGFYAAGKVGSSADMTLGMLSIPVDIEFQPIKNDRFALILFGGFSFSKIWLGIDIKTSTIDQSADITSTMKGPQGGVQLAIKQSDFVFTPFFMFASLAGDTTIKLSGDTTGTYSVSVVAATAYYYGIDIVYVPWDITLSSLIQQVSSSGDNQGYKTYVFTVSYHFSTPAGEKKGDEKKAEPEKKAEMKPYTPPDDTE